MRFSMFRVPKHQQYEYKPRYWDPEKEEREARMRQIKEISEGSVEGSKHRISSGLRRGYRGSSSLRRQQMMRSNLILLGVVAALILLSYLFLVVYLPKIERFFGGGADMGI